MRNELQMTGHAHCTWQQGDPSQPAIRGSNLMSAMVLGGIRLDQVAPETPISFSLFICVDTFPRSHLFFVASPSAPLCFF